MRHRTRVIGASWAVFAATFVLARALPVTLFGVLPVVVALTATVAAVPVLHVQLGARRAAQ